MASKEITKEDIVEALKVIKSVCEDNDCSTCPFGNKNSFCLIKGMTPNAWKINSETDVWRALR